MPWRDLQRNVERIRAVSHDQFVVEAGVCSAENIRFHRGVSVCCGMIHKSNSAVISQDDRRVVAVRFMPAHQKPVGWGG